MADIAAERTDLGPDDIAHLQLLLADWPIISDLSFADLILWLPTWNEGGFIAAAQLRPTTARSHIPDDLVGHFVGRGRHFELDRAFASGLVTDGASRPEHSMTQAVPVLHGGRVIAVVGVYSNRAGDSELEVTYLSCADALLDMVAAGEFPRMTESDQGTGGKGGAPRVGDGLVVMDVAGAVSYASPNARSAFRRLGIAVEVHGQVLADVVSKIHRSGLPMDAVLAHVVKGRTQATAEINASRATVTIRSIPLTRGGEQTSTLVLVRDVTDLRRRDQALLGKDAAIREIHHRVKNNLQTVASLLRLQGRRLTDPSAQNAIAEAGRRVATIAVVHELLAHNPGTEVDLDDVVTRVVALTVETSHHPQQHVVMSGSFGVLSSERATSLALVIAELAANALEHGSKGQSQPVVTVAANRTLEELVVTIADNGPGIDDGAENTDRLGLAIVRTLVCDEMQGELAIERGQIDGEFPGTTARVRVPTHSAN